MKKNNVYWIMVISVSLLTSCFDYEYHVHVHSEEKCVDLKEAMIDSIITVGGDTLIYYQDVAYYTTNKSVPVKSLP